MKVTVDGCLLVLIHVKYPYTDILILIRHIFISPRFDIPFIQVIVKRRNAIVFVFLGRFRNGDFFA